MEHQSQYAVVEFQKKECAVVPLIWLTEENQRCYWPNTKRAKVLKRMVEDATPPQSSWPLFNIVKIHSVSGTVKSCEEKLNEIVTQSSSESCQNDEYLRLINYEEISESDENEKENRKETELPRSDSELTSSDLVDQCDYSKKNVEKNVKRNLKHVPQPKPKRQKYDKYKKGEMSTSKNSTKHCEDSGSGWSDSSDSEDGITNSPKGTQQSSFQDKRNDYNISSPGYTSKETSKNIINNSSDRIRGSTPLTTFISSQDEIVLRNVSPIVISQDRTFMHQANRESPLYQSQLSHGLLHTPPPAPRSRDESQDYVKVNTSRLSFEETVIKKLETIITVQDQNVIKINEIYRILGDNKIKNYLTRPNDFPVLPIDCKQQFKDVERQLMEKAKYDYLKNRLAAIGGSSIRLATNNMLKYLLTNNFAKKFNWAGHNDKKSFKKTKIWEAVRDAVHLHFFDSKPSELNDANIIKAVQDWLRLAPQRHTSSTERNKIYNR